MAELSFQASASFNVAPQPAAVANYATAAKTQNDQRTATLAAHANTVANPVDRAAILGYTRAVQAGNDLRYAALMQYVAALKAAALANHPPPPPPSVPRPPKAPILHAATPRIPPPPPPPMAPAPLLPAHASAEQPAPEGIIAGMSTATKVMIGVGVLGVVGLGVLLLRKPKRAEPAAA